MTRYVGDLEVSELRKASNGGSVNRIFGKYLSRYVVDRIRATRPNSPLCIFTYLIGYGGKVEGLGR